MKANTQHDHAGKLRQFDASCAANGIDPTRPTADDMRLYLLAMSDDDYALSTIAVRRAAIRVRLLDQGMTLPPTADRTVTEVVRGITKAQAGRVRVCTKPVDRPLVGLHDALRVVGECRPTGMYGVGPSCS
jgi:hypothetical protein